TVYLSDEHMSLVKACVEKCRREKMLAWLYDEDRWPSGAAGGIVTKDVRYRARHLLFTAVPYGEDSKAERNAFLSGAGVRAENGTLLACYDVVLDKDGCLVSAHRIGAQDAAKGTKWYAYMEIATANPWYNDQTYVDTLNPAAIRRFIEVTYERYLETVGDDFGSIVPAIFTDEPQFTHKGTLGFAQEEKDVILPWTDDLPETFKAAYGEDLLERLPELFWELPQDAVSTVRYHYHDHISERFASSFADQCGKWCEQHGLMLTGHMMEEPTLKSQTAALGDAMRSYRGFQLPGIDMLCNNFEFTTAKQTQSAVHQFGREGMISELYGVTGWDFDFRGHKLQGDWQAALGVTVRVPHLSWVSMKGEAKRDYPASIHYQSPWWQDYSVVENHFARVNTALTRGVPMIRVGVIHPVESYWLHWGPAEQTGGVREQMDNQFQNLTDWLIHGGIDFDFISESLLPDLCEKGGAPLQVGKMVYDTIVIPACETLRTTTLDRLEAFVAAGGRLVILGDAPRLVDAKPSKRGQALSRNAVNVAFAQEQVLDALESVRMVEMRLDSGERTKTLVHQLRRDGEDLWLFVAHSVIPEMKDTPKGASTTITINGVFNVVKYDTLTGEIMPLTCEIANGKTVITVTLYELDSLLLRYTKEEIAVKNTQNTYAETVELPVPARVQYTLNEPNVYLLDKAEYALDNAPFAPEQELLKADDTMREQLGWPRRQAAVVQPWTVDETKPEHVARLRFTVRCAVNVPSVKLALEDADVATIALNGTPVTAKPDGWFTDKSIKTVLLGDLKAGENYIDVSIPFGRRTNVEWCYLLGDFGVDVFGGYRELVSPKALLGFDDVTRQGLAHYGGNITYHIPVTTYGGKLQVEIPHYRGAAVKLELDNEKSYIIYPPYTAVLSNVPAGEHVLNITLLGNRYNCFGALHLADLNEKWIGPNAWRSVGNRFTDSYRLKPLGILSAPVIKELS
ncbi:MAG: hypothetical protein J6L00_00375, partial [Clostridia bacterium]|nr:hypothetical protein [Clostridia bacterium]